MAFAIIYHYKISKFVCGIVAACKFGTSFIVIENNLNIRLLLVHILIPRNNWLFENMMIRKLRTIIFLDSNLEPFLFRVQAIWTFTTTGNSIHSFCSLNLFKIANNILFIDPWIKINRLHDVSCWKWTKCQLSLGISYWHYLVR